MGYGALIATFIAITLEVLAGFGSMVTAGLLVTVLPGNQATLEGLYQALQAPGQAMDPAAVLDALLTPLTILAAALFLAVLTPLIEETSKSLGVWLAGTARPLGRARAFALGVMAGAGFSLTEAVFNGAAQLPAAWASLVVLRAVTVLIHGLATGLLALGWYEVLHRRPWRFAAYAVAGIGLHGFWNGLGGLSALAGLGVLEESAPGLHVGIALLSSAMLVGTLVVATLVLAWLTTTLVSETRRQAMPADGARAD